MTLLKRRKKTISTVYIIYYSVQTQKRIIASHIKIKTKMKVKNLLLAGLAVAAMTACSNNDEVIDNGSQLTGEKASMQIKLKFSDITRGVTQGGNDKGENVEFKATTITALLVYGGTERVVYPDIKLQEVSGNTNIATTNPFSVAAGNNVEVYVFVNPVSNSLKDLTSKNLKTMTIGTQSLPSKSIDYLTSGIAQSDNFMMSNEGGKAGKVDIIAGSADNEVAVSVERICAKLDERSGLESYSLKNQSAKGKAITIKMINHTYTNLNSDSYILGGNESSWAGGFLQAYDANALPTTYTWKACSAPEGEEAISSAVTYCLENTQNTDIAEYTSVLYEGQVYFGDSKTAAPTFYVANKFEKVEGANEDKAVAYIYEDWASLKADFQNLDDQYETNQAELAKFGVKMYKEGKCYYVAPIQHEGKGNTILRNNWYQLTVNTINDLGNTIPTVPPTDEPEAKLTLKVSIKPWAVQINSIDL